MKVALLTIWHDGNYGAEMQAYATIKALRHLGHNVEMINIRLSDKNRKSVNGYIGSIISRFGPSYRKFNRFWTKYIPTTKRYRTIEEIQKNPPIADIYMVGSDQVWNPKLTGAFYSLYFLNFGKKHIRKVSYASSFGTDCWNHHIYTDVVKSHLKQFFAISCREANGVNILNEVFDVKAEMVLDPTLLFEGYPELIGDISEQSTLVYYPLSVFPELAKFATKIAEQLGLNAVNANWRKYLYRGIEWDRNSIQNWIRDIAQASFVITPSFHGLAFSLIYHRQFAVIVKNKALSNRITNLLNLLGLEDRLFDTLEELEQSKPWTHPINYEVVEKKISEMRINSFNYLVNSLR